MAVHTNKPFQGQQSSQQQHQQTYNQQQQSGFQSSGAMPSFGIQSRLSAFGNGGETFEKLYTTIAEMLKKYNEEIKAEEKYSVIKLLKGNYGLNYSALVVTETLQDVTTAHILMIEKTGDYPAPITENIQGVRYEITRTPADALDDKYITQARQAVADTLKVDVNSVVVLDGTLVPNEFDVNNEVHVHDLLRNAFAAINSEINLRVKDYKGVNIADLIQSNRNGKFFVSLFFNNDETVFFDQANMPVRQDVCIELSYKLNQQRNNMSVNQGDDTMKIVRTYGYVDFESPGVVMYGGVPSTQKFVPNFIITHIDSEFDTTPDILMLAISSVFVINEDMNWMQAFRATPSRKNEIDFNDIGALNIEGNIENSPNGFGKKYDTKSKTFGVAELNSLIQRLVRPNFLVSIDVPSAGPETWFTSVLRYVKFRNDVGAYNRITNALSTMTNGAYQSNNAAMFHDITNKIHGGYYKSKDGVRDIRHLNSYLAVANYIGDTNQMPALITQYANTLYNSSIPSEFRAAERKKFIDEMSNKTVVYKQFHDRLTFSAGFLMGMLSALKTVGFSPVFSSTAAQNDMFMRRSTVDFGSAMLGTDARLMNSGVMYGQGFGYQSWNRMF